MERTQKRCLLYSLALHALLIAVLFIGPAFLPSKPPSAPMIDDMEILDFIPVKTTDDKMSGGGNPKAKAPAMEAPPKEGPTPPPVVKPQPEPAQPKPEPVKPKPEPVKPKPEPVKPKPEPKRAPEPEVKKPVEHDPDGMDVPKKPKLPEVSTTMVVRKNTKAVEAKEKARREVAERERQEYERQLRDYNENRQKLARTFGNAANSLSDNLSSSTSVELRGPGGGGVPYANFLQAVKSRYARAWKVPDGVTDDSAVATASVTIGRDGQVLDARIIKRSGNAEVDRSVDDTLYRVKFAAPLPDTAKEDKRTVSINFSVKARRALG